MREFNLKEAKAGKPVCTRDGRKVRIICFDRNGKYPIVAIVNYNRTCDDNYVATYTENGKFNATDTSHDSDLMMASEKKKGWINVYKNVSDKNRAMTDGYVWETEEIAKRGNADDDVYIGTFPFEWEE